MKGEGDSKRELEDSRVKLVHFFYTCKTMRASLVAQGYRAHLTMQETKQTWVPFLDQEDALEEGMAVHSSVLAWENPMDRGTWQDTVHGFTKSWT